MPIPTESQSLVLGTKVAGIFSFGWYKYCSYTDYLVQSSLIDFIFKNFAYVGIVLAARIDSLRFKVNLYDLKPFELCLEYALVTALLFFKNTALKCQC